VSSQQGVINLIARLSLFVLGAALTLFGIADLLIPRARFVNSNPPAASMIADPPSAVIINFSNKLAPESTMDVTSTIRLLPSGEMDYLSGSSVVLKSGIDSGQQGDLIGKSMRAELRPGLHKGLYWVTWRTTTAGWRAGTYGKTYFTVGMPVPEGVTNDMDGAIWERNDQWRRRRGAIVGGVMMIALGVFMRISRPR
jgi:methionine-rich copper-binding protein CopC